MEKIPVYNMEGQAVSDIALNPEIWAIVPNDAVLYDAITLTRNALRQGSADTKTRSEVSGGGRKPWKQKGTGRARQGSIRSPQWYHGGVVFGPHPRDYDKKMNRKERRLALKSALAYKLIDSELMVLNEVAFQTNKTKDAIGTLNKLGAEKNVLIVVDALDENTVLATRNLKNIILLEANEINTLDVISADKLIITEAAVKKVEEVLS